MALRAGSQRLPSLLRPRTFICWGGALAAGFAAVKSNWRSIGNGDIRLGSGEFTLQYSLFRSLNLTRALSTTVFPFSVNTQMSLTPPQAPPSWNHSPGDITRLTKEFIAQDRVVEDKVGALAAEDCNFQSASILALYQCFILIVTIFRCLWVPRHSLGTYN